LVRNVPRVTIRGLRLRSNGPQQTLLTVVERAPGLLIDGLQFEGMQADYDALVFFGVRNQSDDPPSVVQNCVVRRPKVGLAIIGTNPGASIDLSSRIALRNNLVLEPQRGIDVTGACQQIEVVGNRVASARGAGIHVQDGTSLAQVLVTNNSCYECLLGFAASATQSQPASREVEVVNNLLLRSQQWDMVFLITDALGNSQRGGDAALLAGQWRVRNNAREAALLGGNPADMAARFPPDSNDLPVKNIDVLSTRTDEPDFLRPAAESALATKGAGGDLPGYVGALPPPGVEPWNWDETWKAREPKPSDSGGKE
jgi:hypothetical protein